MLLLAPMQAGAFRIGDINQLPEENQPRKIEEMIGSLPAELRSNFTIMRSSRSLQEQERTILFSQTANTIVTFNAHAGLKGGKALEVMQFLKNPARFELHEIEFDPEGKLPPKVSETNPQKCQRCHGSDPQPIWGNYDADDGAYAPGLQGILSDVDEKDFKALKERAKTDPRLSRLLWNKEKPYFPFFKAEKDVKNKVEDLPNLRLASLLATNVAIKAAEKAAPDPFFFSLFAANVCGFSAEEKPYVDRISAIIDARIGSQVPHFSRLADAAKFSARAKGEDIRELTSGVEFYFFGDSVRAAFGLDAHALSLDMEHGPENKVSQSGFFASTESLWATRMLYLKKNESPELKKWAQNNSQRWLNNFGPVVATANPKFNEYMVESGAFNRSPSETSPAKLCPIFKKIMRQELDTLGNEEVNCLEREANANRGKSVAASLAAQLKGPIAEIGFAEYRKIVEKNRCDQCHSIPGSEIGPPVPFLDRFAMKNFLLKHPDFLTKVEHRTKLDFDPKRRMPLAGDAMSDEDRSVLLEYLRTQQQ